MQRTDDDKKNGEATKDEAQDSDVLTFDFIVDKKGPESEPVKSNLFSNWGGGRGETVPLWLITFTDIMALMLTFFVLLYSMSVPDEEKWEGFSSAFDKGFSRFKSAQWNKGTQDTISIDKVDLSHALDLNYLEALVDDVIDGDERLKDVVLMPQGNRLILSLPTALLFEAGQADVIVEGQRALFSLGGALSRIKNRIEVIGHADPRPITNEDGPYRSNWHLSLVRAANVSAVLENVGYTRPVTVRGLSSARYHELSDSVSEDERLSLARRVDIVIMKDDGSQRALTSVGGF